MSEDEPAVPAISYAAPTVAADRRQARARRDVGIAGVVGLASAVAVFVATVVEEQGLRRWQPWEAAALWAFVVAAKLFSVTAVVVGFALLRRGGGQGRRNLLLGLCTGAGGLVVLVAWAVWIMGGR